MQVKMPENLTAKDLDSIVYVFSKMSIASKQSFIASLLVYHPEHYRTISGALGNDVSRAMPLA
jgi:hypothetical protein